LWLAACADRNRPGNYLWTLYLHLFVAVPDLLFAASTTTNLNCSLNETEMTSDRWTHPLRIRTPHSRLLLQHRSRRLETSLRCCPRDLTVSFSNILETF
jgi:hypothetical protein